MKLYGLMVTKNEASRYLSEALGNILMTVDEMFVYDDQSTDETAEVADIMGCTVVVRPESIPSFLEHEGNFRDAAWAAFEAHMNPQPGQWVLAIDADEVLVARSADRSLRSVVEDAIVDAEDARAMSLRLPVPEVFGFNEAGVPMVRTDGLWGTVAGTRLFTYMPGGSYSSKPMGCGAEPLYVAQGKWLDTNELALMHYGYAQVEDQQAKYVRYSSLPAHGHNNAHIESILKPPTLKAWTGTQPLMKKSFRSSER